MNKWIIICPTVSQGDIPGEFDENDKPILYDTQRDAELELIDWHFERIRQQVNDFRMKSRSFDEIDWEPEDFVSACTVNDDGVITTEEHDVLYDPKTFVR